MASTLSILVIFLLLLLLSRSSISMSISPSSLEEVEGGMLKEELLSLFEVMGSLLEDPTWPELHPHPCNDTPWPGIQCEAVQSDTLLHVTKLHIGPDVSSLPCKPSAKLLSNSLLHLPYLKTLSLFNCFLAPAALPPAIFSNSSSLQHLVMISNPGLSGEIPDTIVNLRSLRSLTLSQNSFHGRIPSELGALKMLEQLDLSFNNLSGSIPSELGDLAGLTIVDLSWNLLDQAIPPSIGELHLLQKLDLSFNKLSGTIPGELGEMKTLALLDLSHNELEGPIPQTLGGLTDLEYFLVEDNPIHTKLPEFLGSLEKLSVVGLSNCGFTGSVPEFFGSLVNLTAISLDRNHLNGSIPPALGSLPNLGQLNLSQNQLSGEISLPEDFVSRLGKRLDVRDNKGLCRNPSQKKTQLYMDFQAPPCALVDPLSKSGNGSSSSSSSVVMGPGEPSMYRGQSNGDGEKAKLQISLVFFSLFALQVPLFAT